MTFTAIPAIDVREGRVVRLRQGNYQQETRYDTDPLTLARQYADAGARWLHLVDLDAARLGGFSLQSLVSAIRAQTSLRIQTGGGVRSEDDVDAILNSGADRVVIGSLAVTESARVMDWLKRFGGEHLTIALDSRRDDDGSWRLPVRGWTETAEQTLFELAKRYADAGLQHLLCTDIARDGMLSGPNVALYQQLCAQFPGLQVQASGGFRDAADILAVAAVGCRGAVLGKALLDGRLRIEDALQAVGQEAATC